MPTCLMNGAGVRAESRSVDDNHAVDATPDPTARRAIVADLDAAELEAASRELLNEHWLAHGYTMPNRDTYPWQWLWDSCFHALTWCRLGDERALTELDSLFAHQTDSGFVPHMNYFPEPTSAIDTWGRSGASTITQPPMYGHAIAELSRSGFDVPERTVDAATRGLRFLLERRRRTTSGLIELCHPWETGCDDSARWDAALDQPWTRGAWRNHKFSLIKSVETDNFGGAIANDRFAVASVGFNALVAFNASELSLVTGDSYLQDAATSLAGLVSSTWHWGLRTWVDDGQLRDSSGRARTVDAHFALLVEPDDAVAQAALADLIDPAAFGALHGPCGIHRDEPTYDPLTYWRGPAWPQMTYLLWVAARRRRATAVARQLGNALRRGALASGFAEYWHPDTGQGLGAIPQSWATLAVLVEPSG